MNKYKERTSHTRNRLIWHRLMPFWLTVPLVFNVIKLHAIHMYIPCYCVGLLVQYTSPVLLSWWQFQRPPNWDSVSRELLLSILTTWSRRTCSSLTHAWWRYVMQVCCYGLVASAIRIYNTHIDIQIKLCGDHVLPNFKYWIFIVFLKCTKPRLRRSKPICLFNW